MHRKIVTFLFALCLGTNLAAQPMHLRYSLPEGTTLRYKLTETTKAFSQLQSGLQSSIDREAESFATLEGEASKTGGISFTMLRDTTFVTEHAGSTRPVGRTPDFLNLYARKPIRFQLSTEGMIQAVQPLTPLNRFAGIPDNMTDSYLARQALFLPPLPHRAVTVGDAWTENRKDTLNGSTNGRTGDASDRITFITTKMTYTAEAMETIQSIPCVKITWFGTVFTESKHITKTGEVFSEDEEKIEGTLWFAVERGALVQMKTKSQTESTMAIFGSEMEIRPSSISVQKTLLLLPS